MKKYSAVIRKVKTLIINILALTNALIMFTIPFSPIIGNIVYAEPAGSEANAGRSLGEYRVTTYTFADNDDGAGNFGTTATASGAEAKPYHTAAIDIDALDNPEKTDRHGIKMGDRVRIGDQIYTVEDYGSGPNKSTFKEGVDEFIDLYMNAEDVGKIPDYAEVFLLDGTTGNNQESGEEEDNSIDYTSLIKICGTKKDGYYLNFVDDIDEKLQDIINTDKARFKRYNITVDELKTMIRADISTKFPNFGEGIDVSDLSGIHQSGGGSSTGSSYSGSFIWPVQGQDTPEDRAGNITSIVGGRSSPGGVGSTNHGGMDIACPTGTPILATADGTVTVAGESGGYGNLVEIDHGTVAGKNMISRYGHNSEIKVTVGQQVKQGDVIALAGSTGNSTGPHCHFEIRMDGEVYDPLNLFSADYVKGNTAGAQVDYVEGYGTLAGASSPAVNTGSGGSVSSLDNFLFVGDSITQAIKDYNVIDAQNCTVKAKIGAGSSYWVQNSSSLTGVNDVKGINVMLGANDYESPDQSINNLKKVLEKLHSSYPSAKIFVDKILPIKKGVNQSAWDQYNSKIGQLGLNYVTVIDVYSDNIEYEGDGLHPTAAGTKTLYNNIKSKITSGGGGTSSGGTSSGGSSSGGSSSGGGKVVVINCGHSVGYDPGATGTDSNGNTVEEARVNQKLAGQVVRNLNSSGFTAYITHTDEADLQNVKLLSNLDASSLKNLGPATNAKNPDLAMSIHHNSGGSSSTGSELYWSSYRDYDAGEGVYTVDGLWSDGDPAKRDKTPSNEAKESEKFAEIIKNNLAGMPNIAYSKTVERDDYLPAHAKCPCILYEGGYISNPSEAAYLNSDEYIQEAARRIAQGISDYLGNASNGGQDSNKLDVIGAAKKVHKIMEDKKYTYGNNPSLTIEESEQAGRTTCVCSIYVDWVLNELGLDMQTRMCGSGMKAELDAADWCDPVASRDAAQPGDIVLYSGHVQMYGGKSADGQDQWYNAGSTTAIQTPAPSVGCSTPFGSEIGIYRIKNAAIGSIGSDTAYFLNSTTIEEGDPEHAFQGAVSMRRATPNKNPGEFNENLGKEGGTDLEDRHEEGLGTSEDVPEAVQARIKLASGNVAGDFSEFKFLKIPYLNYWGNITTGQMIVDKNVANDVLNIFQELYNISYPIENMQPVEYYYRADRNYVSTSRAQNTAKNGNQMNDKPGTGIFDFLTGGNKNKNNSNSSNNNNNSNNNNKNNSKNNNSTNKNSNNASKKGNETSGGNKTNSNKNNTSNGNGVTAPKQNHSTTLRGITEILKTSQRDNNTYSYYYKEGGTHATGRAIDLNPFVNPIVQGETPKSETEKEYLQRDPEKIANENDKKALITEDSEVVKIFEKYGWVWGPKSGDTSQTAYGHFEKPEDNEDEIQSVESKIYNLSFVPKDIYAELVQKNDERALHVFTLDENFNVIVPSWGYEDGKVVINEGDSIEFRKALHRYSMPLSLLLDIQVNTNDIRFTHEMANIAINSEYVIGVQDKITTTETTTTQTTSTGLEVGEGAEIGTGETTTTTVSVKDEVTQTVEPVFVDCWFIKYTKDSALGRKDFKDGDTVDLLMKVNKKETKDTKEEKKKEKTIIPLVQTSTDTTTNTTIRKITYEYLTGADHVSGNAQKFVDVYGDTEKYSAKRKMFIPWLEEFLEMHESTVNEIDIMKYVSYAGRDVANYGLSKLKFNEYAPEDMKDKNSNGTNITGGNVQEKVWNALKGKGYSDIATAAVMGNIEGESNFQPDLQEAGSGVGYGLCQWSHTRRDQLEAYAKSKGVDPSNEDLQIEFLLAELDPNGGCDGYAEYGFAGCESYEKTWKTSTDIAEATTAFCAGFERPSIPRNQTRIDAAQKYYDQYKGK